MKSVAASNTAGQARAVTSVLKTVIIAPCFISCIASPDASHGNISIIHKYTYIHTNNNIEVTET